MDDPNTMQGAEPAAEEMDLSVPDFSVLEETPSAEANDQAGATEGETSTTQEGEPKTEATQEQPTGTTEPTAANQTFDELVKEFPDLTPAKVREALSREADLQRGYQKKFIALAEQRKEMEAERQAIQQLQELSKSEVGRLALEVAKQLQDPAAEARLRKAWEMAQAEPDDANKVYIDRQTEPIRRQLEEMKAERAAMQQAQIRREAETTHAYIEKVAQEKGVNPAYLFHEVDALATAHKLNGGDLTERGLLGKLTDQAASAMLKAREADRLAYLEQWKKDKSNAQTSAPPPTSGGSAPASTQKNPGEMTEAEMLQETIRMLG